MVKEKQKPKEICNRKWVVFIVFSIVFISLLNQMLIIATLNETDIMDEERRFLGDSLKKEEWIKLVSVNYANKSWGHFPLRVSESRSALTYGYDEALIDEEIVRKLDTFIPKTQEQEVLPQGNRQCKHQGKVFGIGLMKTGTTTLVKALELMGYGCYRDSCLHLGLWKYVQDASMVWKSINDITMDIFQHDELIGKFRNTSLRAQAFGDSPWCFLFVIFDKWYPNSKFILTIRDSPAQIAQSHLNYLKRHRKMYAIKGLAEKDFLMLVARRYELHNQFVIDYFKSQNRSNDLLILNFNDQQLKNISEHMNRSSIPQQPYYPQWKPLIEFLGCTTAIARRPFPHLNRGRKYKMIPQNILSEPGNRSISSKFVFEPVPMITNQSLDWRERFGVNQLKWASPYVFIDNITSLLHIELMIAPEIAQLLQKYFG
ncbi:NAD dependent epimerase/dehydratase [Reticulomyxa filosa]|uniref:NAD dependent epimerase/dehydratase n=1 Tax=Reticulomyxa filosa TaxID=46433 RepID=X6PDI4_RETFI|nr:NAD dependent epimerase/dehydratase [Reticulomyxa filosa]|eukprot:ETO36168.1 NAD dependent epimerase/dehydratase [Reticulomyxa filosa]